MVTELSFSSTIAQAIQQAKFPADPQHLYDPIRYILELSGKRIRPMLVLLGAELFGHKDIDASIPVALAIEYFHNFSLLHDDIMDKAPLRRGAPTVHQKWNDSVAILSGDALLVKAYEEIAKSPADKIPSLLRTFNQVALEVCEGQQKDMDFEQETTVSEEQYIEMIRAKTSVLLGGALKMGAILADASTEDQDKIYGFGVYLGVAFQLQDDILDVYGDPKNFGKQVGGDILSDKKTILWVKLQDLAIASDKQLISDLKEEKNQEKKIESTIALYKKYQIRELADQLKERYSERAFENLDSIDIDESAKQNLRNLAHYLMVRTK